MKLSHKSKNTSMFSVLVIHLDETRTLWNLFHHNQQRVPNSLVHEWNSLRLELREDLTKQIDFQRDVASRISPSEPEGIKQAAKQGYVQNLHMARFKKRLWRLVLRILKEEKKKDSALLEEQYYKNMVLCIEKYLGRGRWLWGIFDRVPDIARSGMLLIVELIIGGIIGGVIGAFIQQHFWGS